MTDAEVLSALNGQQILSHDALPLLDAVETPPSSGPGSHPSNEGHCAWSVQVPGYVRGDVSMVVVNRIDPVVAQSAMVEERGQGGYTSLSIGAEAFQQDGMTHSVYFRVGSYLVIVTAENETSDPVPHMYLAAVARSLAALAANRVV